MNSLGSKHGINNPHPILVAPGKESFTVVICDYCNQWVRVVAKLTIPVTRGFTLRLNSCIVVSKSHKFINVGAFPRANLAFDNDL